MARKPTVKKTIADENESNTEKDETTAEKKAEDKKAADKKAEDKKAADKKAEEEELKKTVSLPTLTHIKIRTTSRDIKDNSRYYFHLDKTKTLAESRAAISQELDFSEPWRFFANGASLTPSAEQNQTINDLAPGETELTLQRKLSAKEQSRTEMKSYLEEDADIRKELGDKREAEEKKRRAHMKLTSEHLDKLQKTLNLGDEKKLIDTEKVAVTFKDFFADDAGKKALGLGGTAKDSLRSDKMTSAKISALFQSLGLPCTAGRSKNDGSFKALSFVAQLKADDKTSLEAMAVKNTVAINEVDNRFETFQHEWEKKASASGFSQIAAELSVAYRNPVVSASLSANYKQGKRSEEASASKSEKVHMVAMQEVRKARITIPPEAIKLSQYTTEQFRNAVNSSNNIKEQAEALQVVLDRSGYFVITEYTLGGKLYSSETLTKKGSIEETASEFKRSFGAAVDVQGMVGGGKAAIGVSGGNASGNQEAKKAQDSQFQLSARGGSVTERGEPAKWANSLAIDNWDVISYGRLLPIYEFLADKPLRDQCKLVLDALAENNQQDESSRKKAELDEYIRRVFFNSTSAEQRQSDKVEKHHPDLNKLGPAFDRSKTEVIYTNWADITDNEGEARYFKGVQLTPCSQGGSLALTILVTDKAKKDEDLLENQVKIIDNEENIDLLGKKESFNLGEQEHYIDTTMLDIPRGYRIKAIRPTIFFKNRIGLQIKVVNEKGTIKYLRNKINNDGENYKDSNESRKPCISTTIVPEDHCVTGIRLAYYDAEKAFGIEIASIKV